MNDYIITIRTDDRDLARAVQEIMADRDALLRDECEHRYYSESQVRTALSNWLEHAVDHLLTGAAELVETNKAYLPKWELPAHGEGDLVWHDYDGDDIGEPSEIKDIMGRFNSAVPVSGQNITRIAWADLPEPIWAVEVDEKQRYYWIKRDNELVCDRVETVTK